MISLSLGAPSCATLAGIDEPTPRGDDGGVAAEAGTTDGSSPIDGARDGNGADGPAATDACGVQHDNGVGNTFSDCVPRDTYNQTEATEACVAFTGNTAQCTIVACLAPDGGASGNVVCSSGSATDCICWQYDGAYAGRYYNSGMPGMANCFCPGSPNAFMWH